jgi:hypothetical protein
MGSNQNLPALLAVDTGEGQLPEHGLDRAEYISRLTATDEKGNENQNLLQIASKNIPTADIQLITGIVKDNGADRMGSAQIASSLAMNLLCNRICETCGSKPQIRNALKLCGSCKLGWYCSSECQTAHYEIHSTRCCKPDGPLDKGFQGLVVMERSD